MQHLTLTQTMEKIESLIDTGNGDAGRLYHILESLKKKREKMEQRIKSMNQKLKQEQQKPKNRLLKKIKN